MTQYYPTVFNVFKPVGITSYDVIRHFKKNLPKGYGKIGHVGTLDPFACGVLLVGIKGATRLNELIHSKLSKTYLAIGKLGEKTDTGDLTSPVIAKDDSIYTSRDMKKLDKAFLTKMLTEKFLGVYYQEPHKYSATKFQGRALHEWAREGIEIKKEQVKRNIFKIEVVKYSFPYLSIRFEVSSGTYIRTLFSDCAHYLGTFGHLRGLVREKIGQVSTISSIKKSKWPNGDMDIQESLNLGISIDKILELERIDLSESESLRYSNGNSVDIHPDNKTNRHMGVVDDKECWVYDNRGFLLGMGEKRDIKVFPIIVFSS